MVCCYLKYLERPDYIFWVLDRPVLSRLVNPQSKTRDIDLKCSAAVRRCGGDWFESRLNTECLNPKTGATYYHAQLGLPDKGHAIKELVFFWVFVQKGEKRLPLVILGCLK